MGCKPTKLSCTRRRHSDGEYRMNAPVPLVDPRLPVTAKQKYKLQASWRGISRNMETTGILMFIKLFEEDEQVYGMFPKLMTIKKEELAGSHDLEEHAMKVMNAFDEGIKMLENLDLFFPYLHSVGAKHRRHAGFNSDYFWKLEKPFLGAVEATLGERYTENVSEIYNIIIKFMIETVVEGYNKAPPYEGPRPKDGDPSPKDGGPSSKDGGPSPKDGGPSPKDGGPSSKNGGPSSKNGGPSSKNGGPSSKNGGPSSKNGGPSSKNGEPSCKNGRSSPKDGGSSNDRGPSPNEGSSSSNDCGYSSKDGGPSSKDGDSSSKEGSSKI